MNTSGTIEAATSVAQRDELNRSYHRLNEQQRLVLLAGLPSSIPVLVIAIGVIPAYFYIWLIPVAMETFSSIGILISNYKIQIMRNEKLRSSKMISSDHIPADGSPPRKLHQLSPASGGGSSIIGFEGGFEGIKGDHTSVRSSNPS